MSAPEPIILFGRLFGGKFNGKRIAIDPQNSMIELFAGPTTTSLYDLNATMPTSTWQYRRYCYFRHELSWSFPERLDCYPVVKRVIWYANTSDTTKARELLMKWMFRGSNELTGGAPAAPR